jgi:hypothetical protein
MVSLSKPFSGVETNTPGFLEPDAPTLRSVAISSDFSQDCFGANDPPATVNDVQIDVVAAR